ncbi:hypothetical protein ACLOJK_018485 [Asimina triloba]
MISTTEMAPAGSDSSSNSNPICPNKKPRHGETADDDDNNNNNNDVRFKGVVLQQNGHWGSQIYANHQRIWLGTFKSEKAAAMAYDSAGIKLRSGDAHRNFPWTSLSIQEPAFQDLHTTDAVLNMIRDGSYQSKFLDFIHSQSSNGGGGSGGNDAASADRGGVVYHHLFQKELTPSDVGKLNRLVIPKKHAIKYFPYVPEVGGAGDENGVEDVQLVFYDSGLRSWKFRYCYWKSSQSYVFTRGWNRFVKEKKLKAKDVISFYTCECFEGVAGEKKAFCMIDVVYSGGSGVVGDEEEEEQRPEEVVGKMELQFGMGSWLASTESDDQEENTRREGNKEGGVVVEKKIVRLFGVQIN